MTMTLAHPADEALGRFVEGTLDESERKAVIAHIADCDECRIVAVDSAEFVESAKVGLRQGRTNRSWWLAVAAASILVVAAGFTSAEDPATRVEPSYAELDSRPLEARLSGFRYLKRVTTRGGNDEAAPKLDIMRSDAAEAAARAHAIGFLIRTAKFRHAEGIGLLLAGNAAESLSLLKSAATSDPNNAKYRNDYAVALIATRQFELALAVCDHALRIDPLSLDALFNRAKVLELLGRNDDAIKAYAHYLTVDHSPSSQWADEVRQHLDMLQSSRSPM